MITQVTEQEHAPFAVMEMPNLLPNTYNGGQTPQKPANAEQQHSNADEKENAPKDQYKHKH